MIGFNNESPTTCERLQKLLAEVTGCKEATHEKLCT